MTRDAFRIPKLALGGLAVVGVLVFLFITRSTQLVCEDGGCELRQDSLLRGRSAFPFDARSPPEVATWKTTQARCRDCGLAVGLRYPSGDIELVRGSPEAVTPRAEELRAYLAAPQGRLAIGATSPTAAELVAIIAALFFGAMFLDGLGLAGWRVAIADSASRTLDIEWRLLGLRVRRRSYAVPPGTDLGSVPMRPPHFHWLALVSPGQPPRSIAVLDRPETRGPIESVLQATSLVTAAQPGEAS